MLICTIITHQNRYVKKLNIMGWWDRIYSCYFLWFTLMFRDFSKDPPIMGPPSHKIPIPFPWDVMNQVSVGARLIAGIQGLYSHREIGPLAKAMLMTLLATWTVELSDGCWVNTLCGFFFVSHFPLVDFLGPVNGLETISIYIYISCGFLFFGGTDRCDFLT